MKSQGPEANDCTRRKHGDDNSPPGVKSQGTRVTFAPQEKCLEGFNQERDSTKKGRREGIQGRTEQEERTLRCTHVQMCAQACKQKRQEGVTDLANLKRNQGREGNGGRKERRMGRGKGERKGRKEGRKKERKKEGWDNRRKDETKKEKKERQKYACVCKCCAATTPLPRCTHSPSQAGLSHLPCCLSPLRHTSCLFPSLSAHKLLPSP